MVNMHKRYHYETVTDSTLQVLPVLLFHGPGKKERQVHTSVIPPDAASAVLVPSKSRRRKQLFKEYGSISDGAFLLIYGLAKLMDGGRFGDDDAVTAALAAFNAGAGRLSINHALHLVKGRGPAAGVEYEKWLREMIAEYGAKQIMIAYVNHVLGDSAFCAFIREDGVPTIGIVAESFAHALQIQLVLALHTSAGVGICKLCGKSFARRDAREKYCCAEHGNSARQAEFRKKRGKSLSTHFYPPMKLTSKQAEEFKRTFRN